MITRFKHEKLPRFVAHRGAITHRTENTKEAFDVAYGYKSKFESIGSSVSLECDLRLTKDDVPVFIHDPDTLRVTGDYHLVADMTYDEMQHLDFTMQHPDHSATLITLPEMFTDYPDVVIDLELKEKGERGIKLANIAKKYIEQYNAAHRVILHIPCFTTSQHAQRTFPEECLFELPSKLIDRFTDAVIKDEPAPYYPGYHQMSLRFLQKDCQDKTVTHAFTEQKFADTSRKTGYPMLTYWQNNDQGEHTAQVIQNAIKAGADSLILDDIDLALNTFSEYIINPQL